MAEPAFPYHIFSLDDTAMTVHFGNRIDEQINREVIARFHQLVKDPFPGMIEAVPAYSSYTVYYDSLSVRRTNPARPAFETVRSELEKRLRTASGYEQEEGKLFEIPVCYEAEFAPDIHYLAAEKKISVEEVIQIHTATVYKVYMLGFVPGFPYMGEVNEMISMPRKPQPQPVAAGSVGIAGKQTGIYPLDSPGGWQIIGRTPVILFDAGKEEPALLQAGDKVKFNAITQTEFQAIQQSSPRLK